ncbi:TRADD-N-associated membrane domain-containing protein [Streptomyces lannensis]|uniref:Cyanobacterial TRADD-N associated 2 transmembrane domain-containing protein n=1 Tax=Streptomyces lannensis TaxID=766498 RepID=A0ABP7K6S5_9ACTN
MNDTGGQEESADPYGIRLAGGGTQFNTFHVSGADVVVNNTGFGGRVEQPSVEDQRESLAEQRQRFFFEFLKYSLKQAEWTFRLSICFMSGGAAVILAGGVLALVHAGSPDLSYLPIVTSLTGALFTVGGGALAVHARRARAHVTEQADRMDVKIDQDYRLEKATTLIDRVADPVARDRLNAAAAMKALDMQSSPENMVSRVFSDEGHKAPEELGPGESSR